MRHLIAFECEDATLVGSLDEARGSTGVLIVSGGNEVRAGAHRGMAMLAQALAAAGIPVFRFDRRGVGDSDGDNAGWEGSASDIAAAVAAFRAGQPQVQRIVGFGNCDGATALALFGRDAGVDALVLANPWIGDDSPLPPPSAIRARYARRLLDAGAWRRLLTSPNGWGKLAAGLRRAALPPAAPPTLAGCVAKALACQDATIVLARGDRTAQLFSGNWRGQVIPDTRAASRLIEVDSDSHSFVGQQKSLEAVIMGVISERPSRE